MTDYTQIEADLLDISEDLDRIETAVMAKGNVGETESVSQELLLQNLAKAIEAVSDCLSDVGQLIEMGLGNQSR